MKTKYLFLWVVTFSLALAGCRPSQTVEVDHFRCKIYDDYEIVHIAEEEVDHGDLLEIKYKEASFIIMRNEFEKAYRKAEESTSFGSLMKTPLIMFCFRIKLSMLFS